MTTSPSEKFYNRIKDIPFDFSELLIDFRVKNSLTQKQLAKILGVRKKIVEDLESCNKVK